MLKLQRMWEWIIGGKCDGGEGQFYFGLRYAGVVSCSPDWFISVNKPVDKGSSCFSMQRNRVLIHLNQELLQYGFLSLNVLAFPVCRCLKEEMYDKKMVV